jgi:hypothetical protein
VVLSAWESRLVQTDIFGPLERDAGNRQNPEYLKTQVNLINSDRVLELALLDPLVVNLPEIKRAEDPLKDLREKLKVEILSDTNLIRIALELPDRDEAVAIVNAVTQSYMVQNADYGRFVNRQQTESYSEQLKKIGEDIDSTRNSLNESSKKRKAAMTNPGQMLNSKTETDPTQPTLNRVTEEQFSKLIDKQFQCDLDYVDALAHLEAVRTVRERNEDKINHELGNRVAEEFKKNSKVAALQDQIHESLELTKSKDQVPPPSVSAAREKLERLTKEYEELWAAEFPELRKRLANEDQGQLSESRIRELQVAVERARRKKEGFARQFAKIQVIHDDVDNHSFETAYVNYQLESLMHWEDQVRKNLEQLKYESRQQRYRVRVLDEASASSTPASNKTLKFMAIAPWAVLFLLLGLFLTHEIKAGRKLATQPN